MKSMGIENLFLYFNNKFAQPIKSFKIDKEKEILFDFEIF